MRFERIGQLARHYRLDLLGVFLVCFVIAVYWQFSLQIGDPDGFYHAKIAIFLSQGTILKTLPWMHATTLRDAFTDHHFLYHVLLVPFVKLGNPLLGIKLATAMFGAVFFTVFYWFVKHQRMHAPILWTALLLLCTTFSFRLGLIKANSVALITVLFIIAALLQRKWWLVGALNFIYVWLYGGWFFGWVIAVVFGLITYLNPGLESAGVPWYKRIFWRRQLTRTDAWKALLATVVGSVLGVVINPYFPNNLYFYWQQVWQIAIINQGGNLNVGGEWNPLEVEEFFGYYWYILIAYGTALVLMIVNYAKMRRRSWLFFFLSLLTITFTLKSRRYIELSAPMSVLFAASVWADVFPVGMLKSWWRAWFPGNEIRANLAMAMFVMIGLWVCLPAIGLANRLADVKRDLVSGVSIDRFAASSAWLKRHTPQGSIVVHSDWDDWPMLFYQNSHNYFIVGLDPRFMYNYDTRLYYRWADFTRDGSAVNPLKLVRDDLSGQYVMADKDHAAMNQVLADSAFFRLVYEDDEVWIYQVDMK